MLTNSIWNTIEHLEDHLRWFIYPWMHARVVIRANYAGNRSNWICQASGKWRQVRAANLCMQILCCTQYTVTSVTNTNWFRTISIVSIFYCQPVYSCLCKISLCHDFTLNVLTNVFLAFLWPRINIRRQFGCVIRIPKLMAYSGLCLLVSNVVDSWA